MSREIQEAYKAGYRKGYEDGLKKLLTEASENDNVREEISMLWGCVNIIEERIKKLEKKVYG